MRWPFSYKSDSFAVVLMISLSVHGFIFGLSGILPRAEYAVREDPNSMAVRIIKTTKAKPKPVPLKREEKIIHQPLIKEPAPVVKAPVKEIKKIVKLESDEKRMEKIEQALKDLQKKKEPEETLVSQAAQGAVSEAKPIEYKNPAPLYPRIARRRGWEGVVHLRVLVNRDGSAAEILLEKSSGHKVLDDSALRSVKAWQFAAAQSGDMKFSSWITIPIRFTLLDNL